MVKEAIRKSDQLKVAIKIYDKQKIVDPQKKQNLKNEIQLLQSLNHPNIIRLYEVIETNTHIHLVMEHILGCPLNIYCRSRFERKLDECDAKYFFTQIIKAVAYCHNKGISHRDLKLENILINENKQVKLIDFGFSNDTNTFVFCGTPNYMAPELVTRKDCFAPAIDVWALGVILYVMITGVFPFRASNNCDLFRKIEMGVYANPPWISDTSKNLIAKMMEVDYRKRATVQDVEKDPWVRPDKPNKRRIILV